MGQIDVSSASAVMRGELGIPLAELDADSLRDLRNVLTLETTPWDDQPSEIVECYRMDGTYIWIPRHFRQRLFWQLVGDWGWTEGRAYTFFPQGRLDPERGQPAAVPAMINHVLAHGASTLVSPTGTGKTMMSLHIAASFGRFIGIPVYAGHMVDHWIEDIGKFLGFAPDEIGLVQGERCDLGKPVTVMMIQSLLVRTYPDELYSQIGFLVGDEVGRYGAQEWRKTVAQFPAKYRVGVSANPRRKDGLTPMVGWLFGSVGHRAKRVRSKSVQAPTVIGCHWNRTYNHASFCKWKKTADGWEMLSEAHPSKYDNVLAKDQERNAAIAAEVYNAAITGRQILVFSSRVEHLIELRRLVRKLLDPMPAIERLARLLPRPAGTPMTSRLKAGMKERARERSYKADVQFATFAMARDAYNAPKLDTEVFATPPGDPLQPIGRLREKAEGHDRRSLMILYWFESTPHSQEKYIKHRDRFRTNEMTVQQVERYPAQ